MLISFQRGGETVTSFFHPHIENCECGTSLRMLGFFDVTFVKQFFPLYFLIILTGMDLREGMEHRTGNVCDLKAKYINKNF